MRPKLIKTGTYEYDALHQWLHNKYGSADRCENDECKNKSSRFEWALIKGKTYARNRSYFKMLCKNCHERYDNPFADDELMITGFRLSKSQRALIKKLSKDRKLSQSQVVRDIIDKYSKEL